MMPGKGEERQIKGIKIRGASVKERYENVPAELKGLKQWVCYGVVLDPHTGKWKKLPKTAGGGAAKSNDPGTWTSFQNAAEGCGKHSGLEGVGFVFAGNGIVGVDFDHCIGKDGLDPWVSGWVERLNSYTEISPSGTGLHVFCKGVLPGGKGIHKEKAELYDRGRFFTVTGDIYGQLKPLRDAQDAVDALCRGLNPEQEKPLAPPFAPPAAVPDDKILEIAMNAENGGKFTDLYSGKWEAGYQSQSEADMALCNMLAFYTGKDAARMDRLFRASGLMREKWDRKTGDSTYGAITIDNAIRRCGAVYNPAYGAASVEDDFSGIGGEPRAFFKGRKFLHNVMGDYLVETLSACKINGAIHIYENGVYKQGEETIHGHMLNLVPDLTDTKRREVYKYIKVSLKTPVKEISPPNLIPFATKIYDLNTGAFLDYAPEFVFLNRFPYDYKPGAPYQPAVAETIAQIADGNQEVIDLLYEAIGNCFYLLNSYRGAVMLYGKSGSNGKSTLLNMITQLLGKENASFLSLQDTTERFRLVEIYGKAANIGDDIPNTYLPDSAAFKKLVTGERVMAEKKGQDPFPFKPFAKMFFAMNGLPPVSDKSKAFFGRLLLIPLNKDFSKSGTLDVGLKDRKWTKEEMEYLTCAAMEGLKRLMRQGDFTKPGVVQEAIAGYERDNNPIEEFLAEHGDVRGEPIQAVYDSFSIWCARNGHKNIPTRRRFTDAVLDLTGYASEPVRHPYFGDKTGRCFVGR